MDNKILFVDDDVSILQGYERILHRDFPVSAANCGEQGLDTIRTAGPFAVVISDMRMPGMNGAAFLAKVRERAPDTVRILLTGYSDLDAAIDAVNNGKIFRYLTKPCEKEIMVEAIQSGIAQYRSILANKELVKKAQLISRSSLDWGSNSLSPDESHTHTLELPGPSEARAYVDSLFSGARRGYVALIKLTILEIVEERYGTAAVTEYIRNTIQFLKRAVNPTDLLFFWRRDVLMIVVARQLSPAAMRMELARLLQDRPEMITETNGRRIMVAAPTTFDLMPVSGFSDCNEMLAAFEAKLTKKL